MKSLKQIKEENINKIPQNYWMYKVMRRISIPLCWLLQFTPISANMITISCQLSLIASALLFAFGDFKHNIIAVILMYSAMQMDLMDGALARTKNTKARLLPKNMDRIFHEYIPAFIFLGIGAGSTMVYKNGIFFILGMMACIGQLSSSYFFQLKNFILMKHGNQTLDESDFDRTFVKGKLQSLALAAFVFPMKYLRAITLLFVLLNRMDIHIILYGLFLPFRAFVFYCFNYINFWRLDKCQKEKL